MEVFIVFLLYNSIKMTQFQAQTSNFLLKSNAAFVLVRVKVDLGGVYPGNTVHKQGLHLGWCPSPLQDIMYIHTHTQSNLVEPVVVPAYILEHGRKPPHSNPLIKSGIMER